AGDAELQPGDLRDASGPARRRPGPAAGQPLERGAPVPLGRGLLRADALAGDGRPDARGAGRAGRLALPRLIPASYGRPTQSGTGAFRAGVKGFLRRETREVSRGALTGAPVASTGFGLSPPRGRRRAPPSRPGAGAWRPWRRQ